VSIHAPEKNWFRAPTGAERVWVGLALSWCIIMSIAMPYWHFRGKQNSTGLAYSVAPMDFVARVDKFVAAYKVGEDSYVPVVEPPPGSDVYLLAQMFRWSPILKLKQGQTYRLHISSADLQHGFSLQPLNINFQVLPGYDHIIEMTPTTTGTFSVICNEFCGIGHHAMTGKIIVE
jgi:cytochrome c oxidase subunit II